MQWPHYDLYLGQLSCHFRASQIKRKQGQKMKKFLLSKSFVSEQYIGGLFQKHFPWTLFDKLQLYREISELKSETFFLFKAKLKQKLFHLSCPMVELKRTEVSSEFITSCH